MSFPPAWWNHAGYSSGRTLHLATSLVSLMFQLLIWEPQVVYFCVYSPAPVMKWQCLRVSTPLLSAGLKLQALMLAFFICTGEIEMDFDFFLIPMTKIDHKTCLFHFFHSWKIKSARGEIISSSLDGVSRCKQCWKPIERKSKFLLFKWVKCCQIMRGERLAQQQQHVAVIILFLFQSCSRQLQSGVAALTFYLHFVTTTNKYCGQRHTLIWMW